MTSFLSVTSYHLGPGWHLHCKHTQASAAAAVPALLVVHVDSDLLVGLQAEKQIKLFFNLVKNINMIKLIIG